MSTDNTKKELTAEEILRAKFSNSFLDTEYIDLIVESMQEYATQQTASLQNVVHNLTKENLEYRERLKENVNSIESMLHHNKELTDQKASMAEELERVKSALQVIDHCLRDEGEEITSYKRDIIKRLYNQINQHLQQ